MSNELNHFGTIARSFRYGAQGILIGGTYMNVLRHLFVSQVPHTGKTLQSPKSNLTPWTLREYQPTRVHLILVNLIALLQTYLLLTSYLCRYILLRIIQF